MSLKNDSHPQKRVKRKVDDAVLLIMENREREEEEDTHITHPRRKLLL